MSEYINLPKLFNFPKDTTVPKQLFLGSNMQGFTHPITGKTIKLGKRPARKGIKKLRLTSYVNFSQLPTPALSFDNTSGITSFGEMLNDQIGDCTIAAVGHMVQCWTAANGSEVTIPDADILAAYEAISGYNPNNPASDVGCDMIDVLNYWKNTGIGGHKIEAWFPIDYTNTDEVIIGTQFFGGTYTGVGLPISAQSQVGSLWSVPGTLTGNNAPGSWGGHCITEQKIQGPVINNPSNVFITWGSLQGATPYWRMSYVDEEYIVISTQDWLNSSGKTPAGLSLTQLLSDANDLAGYNSSLAKAA